LVTNVKLTPKELNQIIKTTPMALLKINAPEIADQFKREIEHNTLNNKISSEDISTNHKARI